MGGEVWDWTGRAYIGTGAEEAAFAGEDGDGDVFTVSDFSEQTGDAVVVLLSHGIELFGAVECDDGVWGLVVQGAFCLEFCLGWAGHLVGILAFWKISGREEVAWCCGESDIAVVCGVVWTMWYLASAAAF